MTSSLGGARALVLLVSISGWLAGMASAQSTRPAGEVYTPLGSGKIDPEGKGSFRFVVIGNPVGHADQKADLEAKKTGVDFLNRSGADLVICTGDSNPQWNELCRTDLKVPLYNIPGNHDSRDFTRTWGAMRFSFVHKGVHFIGVDDQTPGVWAEQVQWIKNEIASKPARWRFVFKHEPSDFSSAQWLAQVHPLLAANKTVAGFGSHHGEYSHWEADGIRYVFHRMMDTRKLNYSYMRVDVPAEGRPKLTLVAEDKEYPDDFGSPQSDLQRSEALASVTAMGRELPAIMPGDKEPCRLGLPVFNPSRTEEVTATLTWRVPAETLAKIAPKEMQLKLPPGGSAQAVFSIDASDPGFRPLDLSIKYAIGQQQLAGAICKVLTARRGGYLTAPAEAAPDGAKLLVNSKEQVVLGKSETWTGPDDCSAVASVVWTADALTVTVDVKDDQVMAKDGVELSFDLRKGDGVRYAWDRGMLVVNLPAVLDETNKKAVRMNQYRGGATKVEPTCQTVQGGYRVVAKLTALPDGIGAPGDEMLFDVKIRDADEGHENTMCWSVPYLDRDVNGHLAWGRLTPVK
jgi:hypothetical protein